MAMNPFMIRGMGIRENALRRYWNRWKGLGEKWTDLDRIMLTEPQAIAMVEEVVVLYDVVLTVTSSIGTSRALFQLGCFATQSGSLFNPFTLLLYMRVIRLEMLLYV